MLKITPFQHQPTSKAQIEFGLNIGRALIQFPNGNEQQRRWIEELIGEGKAVASKWQTHPEMKKAYRVITAKPLKPGSIVRMDQ